MRQALSNEQNEIAFYNDCEGAVLVEASAGSGKTRILTERVRYLLTEKKDKFFSVLCLTFTNKAADEMKERLKDVPKLKERAFVGTFHEFCLEKITRTRKNEIGLQEVPHIFDENDKKKILEEVFLENPIFEDDYKNLEAKVQTQRLNNYINVISEIKRNLVVDIDVEKPELNIKERILYNDYNTRLISQNAMDYDDILLYAYRILISRPLIADLYQRTYQYILIDEAQDLNYAQYQIIKTICAEEHRNVMMVGDPKQAIYGFNGASPKYMQKYFVEDFEATKLEIKHNYRSARKILELAQNIRSNGGIGTNFFEGISEIKDFENEEEEAKWVIEKIKEWKHKGVYEEEGKEISELIHLKNICVLARNKYVFSTLIKFLEQDDELKNIFYLRKGVERFEPESSLIKIFDWGLRILTNPFDALHFKQIFNELNINREKTEKKRLEILLSLNEYDTKVLSKKELNLLVELWQKLHKNPKWVGEALKKIRTELQPIETEEHELFKIDFDISELQKYWSAFARKEPSEKQDINNFRYFLALNGSQETNEELILATVHTTKGLEFEIVFLMGMNEGTFPDYRAIKKGEKAVEEERNNAYVAVTRAKRCIYITYPKAKKMPWGDEKPQKISTFLQNLVS